MKASKPGRSYRVLYMVIPATKPVNGYAVQVTVPVAFSLN